MGKLLMWMAAVELAFVGFGALAASSLQMERRSHFWGRALLGCVAVLSMLPLTAASVTLKVLPEELLGPIWLLFIAGALTLAPVFCYRSAGSSDVAGGGGPGPEPPLRGPETPPGGVPLPDAEQASARVRDHNRPRLGGARPRRRVSTTI
jgi:hypothetical protein